MTIREDIAAAIHNADGYAIEGVSLRDARLAADAVLAYIGGLDPDCPAELLVWHVRNDSAKIDELTTELRQAQETLNRLGWPTDAAT